VVLYALILPVSQLQTRKLMTSQIRSQHKVFNTNIFYSHAHFLVKIGEKSRLTDGV